MARLADLWETLTGRISVRNFLPQAVPDNLVLKAFEYAILAPSAHNAQPWRFVWLKNESTKEKLLTAMAERFISDMANDGIAETESKRKSGESVRRFGASSVLILAGISMLEMDKYPDPFRSECEKSLAIQSLGAAIENFLLALYGLGLASRWYCAPLFCPDIVRDILELPQDFEPQAFITAGYSGAATPRPPRKALSQILYER